MTATYTNGYSVQNAMTGTGEQYDPWRRQGHDAGCHDNANPPPPYASVTRAVSKPPFQPDKSLNEESERARKERLLNFYCEICDDSRLSSHLVDPLSYPGQVVTLDGRSVTAVEFTERELHSAPEMKDWRRKAYTSGRIISGFCHIAVPLCIFFFYWVYYHTPPLNHKLGLSLCGVVGCLGYLIIIAELAYGLLNQYVMKVKSESEAQYFAHQLRHATPRLFVKTKRYKTVRNSRSGNDPNHLAWEEEEEIAISSWRDFSEEYSAGYHLLEHSKCKLKLRAAVCFEDAATLQYCRNVVAILEEEASRISGNRTESEIFIKLPDLRKGITVTRSANWCEWLYVPTLYWLSGLCLVSCLYRLWFNNTSGKGYHTIVKVVKMVPMVRSSSLASSRSYDYDTSYDYETSRYGTAI